MTRFLKNVERAFRLDSNLFLLKTKQKHLDKIGFNRYFIKMFPKQTFIYGAF